jgi:hypothetical protein
MRVCYNIATQRLDELITKKADSCAGAVTALDYISNLLYLGFSQLRYPQDSMYNPNELQKQKYSPELTKA